MKAITKMLVFLLCAGMLAACNSGAKKKETRNRKIYLTEQDYLDDLIPAAELERRETPPAAESEYIFNVGPEEKKTIYFFDDRQQPKVPGQPSDADYKKEKRLWKKPKRYTPDQYYGMQGEGGGEESSSSGSDSYGYDY